MTNTPFGWKLKTHGKNGLESDLTADARGARGENSVIQQDFSRVYLASRRPLWFLKGPVSGPEEEL